MMMDEWPPLTKGPVSLFFLTDEAIFNLDDRKAGDKYIFQYMIVLVLQVVLLSVKQAMNTKRRGVQSSLLQTVMFNSLNIYNIKYMLIFVFFPSALLIYWYDFIIFKNDVEEKESAFPIVFLASFWVESFIQWLSYLRSQPLR